MRRFLTVLAGVALTFSDVAAQRRTPELAAPVVSLGQPPQWLPYLFGAGIPDWGRRTSGARLVLGVHRPVGSPVIGFGLNGEAYGTVGGQSTAGLRLLGAARALNLSAGVDWDARARNTVLLLSWQAAVRRGGLFGDGSMLRVDWLPARPRSLALGISVPVAQPNAGRTRPSRTAVSLPRATRVVDVSRTELPAASLSALNNVREAAGLITLYSSFFNETGGSRLAVSRREGRRVAVEVRDSLRVTSRRYPNGRGYAEAHRVYGAALADAFDAAAPATGLAVATRARAGLLDHVILPYDTLFGRVKTHQRDISGLTSAAQASFEVWLRDSSTVPSSRQTQALAVHARWLDIVSAQHAALVRQWRDSRRIWLPMQLALAPEDYNEQREVDALLGRASGRPFTDGNALTLLQSTDLPIEFGRSVLAARDYHVLWIHDFVGRGESGAVDRIGHGEVVDGYYPALTRAVQRYDSSAQLTTFQIFLDENFYAVRDGRLWMTMLEHPLDATIRLPGGNDGLETRLRARQQELRAAVAGSKRLQAEAATRGGARWIRDRVKVHVSITQPSDFSFRSHRLLPPIPFLPDNLMRDHRKLAFYDLTEADPYRGAMVMGGVGLGEPYSSATWDDRGLLLRGPAAVEARAAARRLLRLNGIADVDIPVVLRDATTARATEPTGGAGAAAPVVATDSARNAYATRALLVHNEPGFGRKQSSVARAMLYNLAPRGSVIIVPDPLWISAEWAGMLAGAALRGCRVIIIAPSATNSPNSQAIALAQMADVISRLVEIQNMFGDDIARAGGELRIGIYAATEDVNDVAKQIKEAQAGLERSPWLRTLIPFDLATLAVLDTVGPLLQSAGYRATAPSVDRTPRAPKLHLKMQFVAAPDALVELTKQTQWPGVFGRWLLARARQSSREADEGGLSAAYASIGLDEEAAALLRDYEASRTRANRNLVSFYLTSGTQNQDSRGMMLDGEAQLVVSGNQAAAALPDFYLLMARTTWITSQKELDVHLPVGGALLRWVAQYVRYVL